MKTGIICVLAFIALANGQGNHGETDGDSNSETKGQVCVPRSTKMQDCNSCFCLEDGSGWGCTLMGCESIVKGSDRPNVLARIGRDVTHATRVQSNTETEFEVCVPGTTKKIDCNSCFCTENGWGWACTRRGCLRL